MTAVAAALSMCVGSVMVAFIVMSLAINLASTARRWFSGVKL